MEPTPSRGIAIAIIVWLATAVLVTAPLWMTVGPNGLWLGMLGPSAVLFYKPGQQVASKIVVAMLAACPALIGLAIVAAKWPRLSTRSRFLSIVVLSTLWHGVATGVWWLVMTTVH